MKRVATFKRGAEAIIVELSGRKLEISREDLKETGTAGKITEELNRQAGAIGVVIPRFFVHVNRDGSIAMATGLRPKVWPEDENEMEMERFHG